NKVYKALENTSEKISLLEFEKYYEKYKDFDSAVLADSDKPTQTYIQQNVDSASSSSITFQKSIIEKENIPISHKGDSLKLTRLWKDEGLLSLQRTGPQIL